MKTLNPIVRSKIETSVLCWLATISPSNEPNVSPKEMFLPYEDDGLVIANIASPASSRNIRSNPAVCVSFIDIFEQKGFKIHGEAAIIENSSPEFGKIGHELINLAGPDFPISEIFKIQISKISPIIAPSYKIFPDRTPDRRRADALAKYGVQSIS